MGKIARITNDGKLLIKGELIEEGVDLIADGLISQLDANTLNLSESDEVLEWGDSSGNNLSVTYVGGEVPLYSETDINGNPAVLFQRDELEYPSDFRLPPNSTVIFMVNQWQSNGTSNIFGNQGVTTVRVGRFIFAFRGGLLEFTSSSKSTYIEPSPDGVNILGFSTSASGEVTIFTGDREITESGHSTDFYYEAPRLSYNLGSRTFRGSMGEVLIYDRVLSKEEREEVKLYLEAKWLKDKEVSFKSNGDLRISGKLTEVEQVNPLMRISNIFNIAINELVENHDFIFKPLSMKGIQAYFDASVLDVGNIPIWEDLTGNGNNLVASSNPPVVIPSSLNGLNTLAFDTNPMTFPSDFKIQPNASIYMIVKSNSVGGTLQSIMGTQGITAVTAPRFYIAYHGGYLMRTQGAQTSSRVSIQDDFVLYSMRHDELGNMKLIVNDAIVEVDGHITEYNDEVVQFGFSSYRGFKGEIGELIIFNRMLNDKEHNALYGYLREKWGV